MRLLFTFLLALAVGTLNAATTEAVSSAFSFDTRSSAGTTEAVSAAFDLNARDAEVGSSASSTFVMDTRGGVPQWLTITGQVRGPSGQPVAGASVELRRYAGVFWSGLTGADGTFSIPTQVAAPYTLIVAAPGFLPRMDNIWGTGSRHLNLVLGVGIAPPALLTSDRVVTDDEKGLGIQVSDSVLRRMQGSSWGTGAALNPAKPTVVISHGWRADPDSWARTMGFSIASRAGGADQVNVVAWDWRNRASGGILSIIGKIDIACLEGEELGKALRAQLGANYSQPIHFIGHSLGTIVNKYACDYLYGRNGAPQGWDRNLTKPHLTLLDEAELSSVFGEGVVTSTTIATAAMNLKAGALVGTVREAQNWKHPIARDAVWVDNYISAVGLQRPEAVNVCLLTPSIALGPPSQLWNQILWGHEYAHLWYRNTISESTANNGFQWSGLGGAILPHSGTSMAKGSVWWENLDSPAVADVSRNFPDLGAAGGLLVASGIKLDCGFPILRGVGTYGAAETFVTTTAPARGAVSGMVWAGEGTLQGMEKVGNVTISTVQKTGMWLDASIDNSVDWFSSLNPAARFTGSLTGSVWSLLLRTAGVAPQIQFFGEDGLVAMAEEVVEEPGAWFTVPVPADAAFLAFDFIVRGDPAQDVINCAVGGQNVFSLSARFVDQDEISSTDMIDISQHAGQEVEFYFGLNGGSSHGCELVIEGVRFIKIPPPSMRLEAMPGGGVRIDWPALATGWKPEFSPSLREDDWHPLDNDEEDAILENGRAIMERPADGPAMFYRLRRDPE